MRKRAGGKESERREWRERERERARCKIKDDGNLIEIVAIITHSGAAVGLKKSLKPRVIDRKKSTTRAVIRIAPVCAAE